MFRAAPNPVRVTPRHPPRHGRAPPASASEFHRVFDRLEVLQRVGQVVLLEDADVEALLFQDERCAQAADAATREDLKHFLRV